MKKGVPYKLSNNLKCARCKTSSKQDFRCAKSQGEGNQCRQKIEPWKKRPAFPRATQPTGKSGSKDQERGQKEAGYRAREWKRDDPCSSIPNYFSNADKYGDLPEKSRTSEKLPVAKGYP
jgi:hypothetical protein